MILHKSKYVEIIYEQENSLITQKFLPETEDMTQAEFRAEMNIFVEMCQRHKPERELVYLLDMKYVIALEDQEWMDTEVLPQCANIIKRMAFFMPTELFAQVSIEQTMEEENGQKFVQQYFENEDEARKWLMKQ